MGPSGTQGRSGSSPRCVTLGSCSARSLRHIISTCWSNVSDSAARSGRAVRALLSSADERLWWSLSDDFRNLAEAAPASFLECVDDALDRDPSPMAALFRRDEGFLHPSEYLSDLLWALELLCWSPKHLGAGALLLARLADVDPGGICHACESAPERKKALW